MAWLPGLLEQLPKAVVFGLVLLWVLNRNTSLDVRAVLIVLAAIVGAVLMGRVLDRWGLPEWVFAVALMGLLFVFWLATWNTVFR